MMSSLQKQLILFVSVGMFGLGYLFGSRRKKKTSSTIKSAPSVDTKRLLDFLLLSGRLKREKRTGWVDHNVPDVESVSDHSWRVALMAMVMVPPTLNVGKAVQIGLCHDVAEAIVGDITPYDGISKEDKMIMEMNAIQELSDALHGSERKEESEVKGRFLDYEYQRCEEAIYVKDIDKLEMIVQAYEYELEKHKRSLGHDFSVIDNKDGDVAQEKGDPQMDLERFFTSVEGKLKTRVGEQLRVELMKRRLSRVDFTPSIPPSDFPASSP